MKFLEGISILLIGRLTRHASGRMMTSLVDALLKPVKISLNRSRLGQSMTRLQGSIGYMEWQGPESLASLTHFASCWTTWGNLAVATFAPVQTQRWEILSGSSLPLPARYLGHPFTSDPNYIRFLKGILKRPP